VKAWASDNPKAGLLRRKREAILAAARQQFLDRGYGGTSMEAVAAAAGVSIMTLYRHAESKDDLFAAVVAIACHSPDEPEPDLSGMALREILEGTAVAFQQKLASPGTMALLRAVIGEHERFPELAGIAYDAAVGHLAAFVDRALKKASESSRLAAAKRKELSRAFIDDLFGADTLRILLGLRGGTDKQVRQRAAAATARLLAQLRA
jgi:TetR/AcrR family transcriptional repressor of mexJK operon